MGFKTAGRGDGVGEAVPWAQAQEDNSAKKKKVLRGWKKERINGVPRWNGREKDIKGPEAGK
jgi:hypothetical protein